MQPTLGRTQLTILPSRMPFLPWAKARDSMGQGMSDYALLLLGTNDITHLRQRSMAWSEGLEDSEVARRVRARLRAILRWVGARTRKRLFVVEPLNEMSRRAAPRLLVAKAMEQEVRAQAPAIAWLPMAWSERDLQMPAKGGRPDPRHFGPAAVRRLAQALIAQVKGATHAGGGRLR